MRPTEFLSSYLVTRNLDSSITCRLNFRKLRRFKIPDSDYLKLTNVLKMKMEGMKKGTKYRKERGGAIRK